MPAQTDVWETVFKLTGASEFAATLAQLTRATNLLNQAQAAAAAGTLQLGVAMGPVLGLVASVMIAVGALTAAFHLLTASLSAFSDESRQLFQTGTLLRNLGSSLSLPQLQQFASGLSERTGLSRPAIEGTAGLLTAAGVQGPQLERMLLSIANASRGMGVSFEEAGRAIEHGILGHMRGLAQFGIVLQDTGSKAANAALIMQQLDLRFEGAATAFRFTLPGAVEAFASSWQRFLSALGEQFAPAAIAVLAALTTAVDFLTAHIKLLAAALAAVFGGPGALGAYLGGQVSAPNPVQQAGKAQPASEETAVQQLSALLGIADNTKIMSDAVIQQVLGGSGEIVNQSFGFLQGRIAMAI